MNFFLKFSASFLYFSFQRLPWLFFRRNDKILLAVIYEGFKCAKEFGTLINGFGQNFSKSICISKHLVYTKNVINSGKKPSKLLDSNEKYLKLKL